MPCGPHVWPPTHSGEPEGDALRRRLAEVEPPSLRTYTPSLAVISHSAGVYHWTADGRRLFDFTSGVLVANLGHNPSGWLRRFRELLGWEPLPRGTEFSEAVPLTAYNACTPIEIDVTHRLIRLLRSCPGGARLERVVWAASGSEAIHKALWSNISRDPERQNILATRHGFHGKKGLANAVTGCETDPERDPRVRFIAFPQAECRDLTCRSDSFDPGPYANELERHWEASGGHLAALITEPYLGGGGSYHPHAAYLKTLEQFCRRHDVALVLDEVQSNFGRTGELFAFEKYGVEPDLVVLGKSLGNGVPVAAVAGRTDILDRQGYGEMSDTWIANPLSCAAVVATLEAYEDRCLLAHVRDVSAVLESGLVELKQFPNIRHVRGEAGGMVWGVETADHGALPAAEWAVRIVQAAYRGDGARGVHLLGPLAGRVIRIAPPLVITRDEAEEALELLRAAVRTTIGEA